MLAGEAILQAASQLGNAGVDSPRLDAELLLAHVLELNRASILARTNELLTPKQLTKYRNLVERRRDREPLAYILGHREFYGLEFSVDQRALVPRPETELLVEKAIGFARKRSGKLRIADVGAGSGAIGVTLAVHLPQATVFALDALPAALELVGANARRHGVSDRVRRLRGDLLGPLQGPVDLVIANLPYVTSGELESLEPEIRCFEPRSALDGGPDGLELIRRLLSTAEAHLRAGGSILVEIGASQGQPVSALARDRFPQAQVRLCQDYAGLDRVVAIQTE